MESMAFVLSNTSDAYWLPDQLMGALSTKVAPPPRLLNNKHYPTVSWYYQVFKFYIGDPLSGGNYHMRFIGTLDPPKP